MAARKSERILNLAICLLMARRFVEREHIRQIVPGYEGMSDVNFERTFERDKDELRAMGVPVETGSNSALFPDEVGYRIRRQDFELPPIEFTPAEATVLGLATRVWDQAALADRAVSALAKLRAIGVDPDPTPLAGLAPAVEAREPAFEPLWQATLTRTKVGFDYRGQQRTVQPWSMTYRRGSWYLLGFDELRGDKRAYKLSRFESVPKVKGKAGSYQVPDDVDFGALLRSLEPASPDSHAVLGIRQGRAPQLRRRGTPCESPVPLPPGYEAYDVPYARAGGFTGEVSQYGPDVLVVAPADLRTGVIRRLQQVVGSR